MLWFSNWLFAFGKVFALVSIPDLSDSLKWVQVSGSSDIQYTTISVPLFFENPEWQNSKTIHITTQRKCSNMNMNKIEKAVWLLFGGPGANSDSIEHAFMNAYYSFLKDEVKGPYANDICVFIVHHRGTSKSAPLPTESNFSQTIQSLSKLLKQEEMDQFELNGFTSIQASFDVITMIKAVKAKNNYIHGYSYGAYWAIQVANQLSKLKFTSATEAINVKGVVIDAGLPLGFRLNTHFKPTNVMNELLKNCENSFICNNFANKKILQEGLKALENGTCSICIDSLKKKFPELSKLKTPIEMFHLLFELFLECEKVIAHVAGKNSKEEKIFVLDLRVIALQLVSHFADDCKDSYRFQILLDITRHILNFTHVESFDNLQSPPVIHISLQDSISPGGEYALLKIFAPSGSGSFSLNYLLFANIVYRELWDYDNASDSSKAISDSKVSETDEWSGLMLAFKNSLLHKYASSFKKYLPNQALDFSAFESSTFISLPETNYLILAGALDYRTPLYASQRIYNDLISNGGSSKQIITFLNRGHVISGFASNDKCSRAVLKSFYLDGKVKDSALSCVQHENKIDGLDWAQESLVKHVGIHLWSSERVGWWPSFVYYWWRLLVAWPSVWIFAGAGILILLGIFLIVRIVFRSRVMKKRASLASEFRSQNMTAWH